LIDHNCKIDAIKGLDALKGLDVITGQERSRAGACQRDA
jgi:hypothetical protein